MEVIIIEIIEKFGYIGIFLLIAIENIFPPIPSEIILTFGGFTTTITNMNIIIMIIVATLGSIIGAILLYYIGRILNQDKMEKLISGKTGRILRLKQEDIQKAYKWFNNKGKITVLFCRFIPIVRSLISIPAGMAKMEFSRFILFTAIGSLIWNTILIKLGEIAGNSWHKIAEYVDQYAGIVLILLITLLTIGIVVFYRNKRKKKKNIQTEM